MDTLIIFLEVLFMVVIFIIIFLLPSIIFAFKNPDNKHFWLFFLINIIFGLHPAGWFLLMILSVLKIL